MDSSLSKALIMAAGVLLGMIVIAFGTYSFRQMSTWSTAKEQEVEIEQKDKFNKEYEVYDKDLMYGVDVISCLNKAKSNNDKIDGKYAEALDKSYEIKVNIKLIKPLEESIIVYHMTSDGTTDSTKNKEYEYASNEGPSNNVKISDVGFTFLTKDYEEFSDFKSSNNLKTIIQKCKITSTEFGLSAKHNATNEEDLRNLLSVSNSPSETKKNKNSTTSSKKDGWTKAEFKSALYDLKTRKFRCTGIKYNTETGRVNEISFTEFGIK